MFSADVLFHVGLTHYLLLSGVIFCVGLTGTLLRRNAIVILMSIELMLNSVNLAFVAFSRFNSNVNGEVIVFFIISIAACEAAVGLALAVAIFKKFKEINIRLFENLKG